jgi:hypothetical protein
VDSHQSQSRKSWNASSNDIYKSGRNTPSTIRAEALVEVIARPYCFSRLTYTCTIINNNQ